MLVEELRPERSLSHSPLFQILLVLQNAEQAAMRARRSARSSRSAGAAASSSSIWSSTSLETEGGLVLSWTYKKELFDGETIERMASSFRALLEGILESPEERVESLPLLTEAERRRAAVRVAGAGRRLSARLAIHELFEAQAERSPEAIAVVFGGRAADLRGAERAVEPAGALPDRAGGRARRRRWGLSMERSLEMLVGMLGILKAGGAYVPLDPEYPEARLAYMLEDSRRASVRADARRSAGAARSGAIQGDPDPRGRSRPSDLAYVIYTSGSTGQPKGVMVEHRSVVRLVIDPDFVPLDCGDGDAAAVVAVVRRGDAGDLGRAAQRRPSGALSRARAGARPARTRCWSASGVNTLWLTAGLFDQWSHQLPRGQRAAGGC